MPRHFLKKFSKPSLDPQTAEEILKEVFERSGKEPNPTPLEVLISYRNYRQERYALQKHVLDFVLLLFFLLPLLFVLPVFSLTPDADAEPGRPVYSLNVHTILPITRVTAVIDGYNISVYETDNHTYSIEPTRNGNLTVTVTLANNQYVTREILVKDVDREAPKLFSSRQENGSLYLTVTDNASGIYYEGIYALDEEEQRSLPLSWDSDTGCIEFLCPKATMNIYIPDYSGNQLQLVVSVTQKDAQKALSIRNVESRGQMVELVQ